MLRIWKGVSWKGVAFAGVRGNQEFGKRLQADTVAASESIKTLTPQKRLIYAYPESFVRSFGDFD